MARIFAGIDSQIILKFLILHAMIASDRKTDSDPTTFKIPFKHQAYLYIIHPVAVWGITLTFRYLIRGHNVATLRKHEQTLVEDHAGEICSEF